MNCHKWRWIDIAMAREECSEVFVRAITLIKIVQFYNVEVLFSVEEFVCVVTEQAAVLVAFCIPLREVVFHEEHRCFEWLVVNQREYFFLVDCVLNQLPPNLFICVLSEHHIVNCVEQARVI